MPRLLAALSFLALPSILQAGPCQAPLDRHLLLDNSAPFLVEWNHAQMAAGEAALDMTLPRRIGKKCRDLPGPQGHLVLRDSGEGDQDSLALLALVGEEYRFGQGSVWATEAGGIFSGRKGMASFNLDARLFAEAGGDSGRPSFDREGVDEQAGEISGSFDHRAYNRFRGDLNLNLPFGTLTAARDAAHWGPGVFGNNMLSQEAVPFFQYSYSARLGALQVTSLYGDLLIGNNPAYSRENLVSRSLYAHRYELTLGKNWLVGMSEQIILYDMGKPFLFVPIFPLFISKGFLYEENNNGNLGFDLTWRASMGGMLYGELLIDDLESPFSLFTKSYSQNKWAALVGTHWVKDFRGMRAGAIFEISHVQPWVYSHFTPATAQAAHQGYPLGNQAGPDSRTLILKLYSRWALGMYAGSKLGLYWKGRAPGSDWQDATPKDPLTPTSFLAGDIEPDWVWEPDLAFTGRFARVSLGARVGTDPAIRAGLTCYY